MAEFIGIDFTKRKKDAIKFTLPVEAGSDEGFELSVLPPTKRVFDSMSALVELVDKFEKGEVDEGDFDMDSVLKAVSEAMSRNAQGKRITPEYLDSIEFDLIDAGEFLGAYLYFISQLVEEKNYGSLGPSQEVTAQGQATATS